MEQPLIEVNVLNTDLQGLGIRPEAQIEHEAGNIPKRVMPVGLLEVFGCLFMR